MSQTVWLFFCIRRQASLQPQNVAFKNPTAVTSDPRLQSSRPGWDSKSREHSICTSSLGKVSRFRLENLPQRRATEGGLPRFIKQHQSRTKTSRESFSLQLFESWCLNRSPYRRALLSWHCALLQKPPIDQLFFIGIKTQHWKHAASHQSWVSSPQWLLEIPKEPMKKRNFLTSSFCLSFFFSAWKHFCFTLERLK